MESQKALDSGDGNCIGLKGSNGNQNATDDERDALGNTRYVRELTAKMPVERTNNYYNMNHKRRGKAVIFNHEHFTVGGLKSRTGTKIDCQTMETRLDKLGFSVTIHSDLKMHDFFKKVEEIAKTDHSDNDCLVIVVLSHGEQNLLYASDYGYKPESLWNQFTPEFCPTLSGKPKLFFIQACQGDKLDAGVILSRSETDGHPSNSSYKIPTLADFLIAYSTVPGYYSWRNTTRGSWFIQALCRELEANGTELDLLTLLTFTAQRVALDYESNTPDMPHMHAQKQIPCVTSMLIRLLRFTPKTTLGLSAKISSTAPKEKSRLTNIFHIGKTHSCEVNHMI